MANIKIIFVDVDWTLYDHKAKCFNKSGLRALNKAHKKGVKIFLCTGRPYRSMKGVGALDAVKYDGYVCANGGIAYAEGEYVVKNLIDPNAVKEIITIAKKHNLVVEVMPPDDAFLVNEETDIVKRFYENWVEVKPRYQEYNNEEVTSMLLFSSPEHDRLFKKLPVYFYRFFDEGADIYAKQYHKGQGVKAILDHYGFSKDEAMGIGDDIPDIEMFEQVKYSICMGNGREEAKEKAFYVTEPIDKKGLKKALKKFNVI